MYEKTDLSKIEGRCRQLLNSPYLRRQVPEELKNLRAVLESVVLLVREDVPSLLSEIKQLRSANRRHELENTGAAANIEPPPPSVDLPSFAPMGAVLGVKDIEQASKFYQTLGFEVERALPGADGRLTVAILNYGPSTLLLGRLDELHYEHEARAKQIRKGPHGLGVTLTLLVPDLTKVYDAVKEAGLDVLLEPVDEFYGDRAFIFLDPDGYEWKVSQAAKEVSVEEVAGIVARS